MIRRLRRTATNRVGRALAALAIAGCSAPSQAQHRWLCGEAFAIDLQSGESATSRSPVEDFVVHTIHAPSGILAVYEGNAPQPYDELIRTGLQWPQMIAIHDNRNSSAADRGRFRDRLLIGTAREAACPRARHQS
jgi:hypothetical protein